MPRLPPPLLALAAGVAQHRLDEPAPPTVVRTVLATGIAAASVGLAGGASARFRRSHTTVEPFRPEKATALVTDGPNAVTRNPMYVGMAGLLVANAVRRGSPRGLLPVAAFVAYIDRVQIAAEEAALRTRFGEEYAAYLDAVPRWLDGRSWSSQR